MASEIQPNFYIENAIARVVQGEYRSARSWQLMGLEIKPNFSNHLQDSSNLKNKGEAIWIFTVKFRDFKSTCTVYFSQFVINCLSNRNCFSLDLTRGANYYILCRGKNGNQNIRELHSTEQSSYFTFSASWKVIKPAFFKFVICDLLVRVNILHP